MRLLLITFSLLLFTNLYGQNSTTDKFIRIVGLSEKTVDHDQINVEYSLSEIEGNEYKQIRPKLLENVISDFDKQLSSSGINTGLISTNAMNNLSSSRYSKTKSKNFAILLDDEAELEKFKSLDVDGLKISKASYVFNFDYSMYRDAMVLEAIKDAKRKAENIAKAVDKKVGKLLNIDDKTGLKAGSKYDRNNSEKMLSYSINVTFELL